MSPRKKTNDKENEKSKAHFTQRTLELLLSWEITESPGHKAAIQTEFIVLYIIFHPLHSYEGLSSNIHTSLLYFSITFEEIDKKNVKKMALVMGWRQKKMD